MQKEGQEVAGKAAGRGDDEQHGPGAKPGISKPGPASPFLPHLPGVLRTKRGGAGGEGASPHCLRHKCGPRVGCATPGTPPAAPGRDEARHPDRTGNLRGFLRRGAAELGHGWLLVMGSAPVARLWGPRAPPHPLNGGTGFPRPGGSPLATTGHPAAVSRSGCRLGTPSSVVALGSPGLSLTLSPRGLWGNAIRRALSCGEDTASSLLRRSAVTMLGPPS